VKVRWSDAARQDRLTIFEYVCNEAPMAALELDERFDEAAQALARFPMMGRAGIAPGTRELVPHENYRLVYEVDEAAQTVLVLALIHVAREWPLAKR
jgi:toxin ParE1/3/4